MRVVIAQMKHETNTYSPVPTPLSRFASGGTVPLEGDLSARQRDVNPVRHPAPLNAAFATATSVVVDVRIVPGYTPAMASGMTRAPIR